MFMKLKALKRIFPDAKTITFDEITQTVFTDGKETQLKTDLNAEILKIKQESEANSEEIENNIEAYNALHLENKTLKEILELMKIEGSKLWASVDQIPKRPYDIIDFKYIENGKSISKATDKIDSEAADDGYELFCPHSKEEYERARQYLLSIKKPKGMGPLGIYPTRSGYSHSAPNKPLTSEGVGKRHWAIQDGFPTWWASDLETIPEPNGVSNKYDYLGIDYDNQGNIIYWNDEKNKYKYKNYLCVKRVQPNRGGFSDFFRM